MNKLFALLSLLLCLACSNQVEFKRIDAEFKNGILNIVVPKKEETSNKKRIEIK